MVLAGVKDEWATFIESVWCLRYTRYLSNPSGRHEIMPWSSLKWGLKSHGWWRSCVRWSRCKLSESKESWGFFFFFVFQSLYPWNWSRTDGRWIPRSTNCFRQGSMYQHADTIILTHFSPAVPTTSGVQPIFIAPSRSIKSLNIFWSPQSLSPWTFAASLFSFLACINNVRALGADSSCVSVFKQ